MAVAFGALVYQWLSSPPVPSLLLLSHQDCCLCNSLSHLEVLSPGDPVPWGLLLDSLP